MHILFSEKLIAMRFYSQTKMERNDFGNYEIVYFLIVHIYIIIQPISLYSLEQIFL